MLSGSNVNVMYTHSMLNIISLIVLVLFWVEEVGKCNLSKARSLL